MRPGRSAPPRCQTFFRVTLPNIRWALLYGIALTTARALGEIGAVLIVSGAIQGQTETATLYVLRALEERQDASAYVVAIVLAMASILLLAHRGRQAPPGTKEGDMKQASGPRDS